MKKLALTYVLLFSFFSLFASKDYEVNFSQPESNTYVLNFNLENYQISEIKYDGVTYSTLQFGSSVFTKRKGFAQLPFIHAAVQLPAKKNVDIIITGLDYEEYSLTHPLLPSRGVIYRDQDPSTIPYIIDPRSIVDNWYPENLATNTEPYIIKDVRGTTVYVYPFQYNAKQKVLRVYKNIKVELVENNTTPVNPLNVEATNILSEMDAIYNSVFINYGLNHDDLTIAQHGDILVICTDRDETVIDPYIQWKKEKGYNVTKEVVATGTMVKTIIQNAYNQNNDLLYVQLVGDWADIKSETLGGNPMDPQLGCVVGTDDQPDICIGRISANTTGDVTIQVNKIINYEKNPEMGASWYKTATGIASNQGPGDDNEMDYEHNDTIWACKLDPLTFDSYNAIYDPSASTPDVTNAVETGTSIINYTGHGSSTSWGTTGFSSSNVANLTNGNKLPWIVSVACFNGVFHEGTCFAEAWLRHDGGGAVMMLAATISQPWDPPMRGQDYFMDVMIGGYDYDIHPTQNGINTNEQRTSLGAIVFNGLVLMTTESGTSDDWETAKTWTTFGDPSMQVRTDTPADLTLSNEVIMVGIPFTTTVTTASGPVEEAMITLSQGDDFFTGITDTTGTVSITHSLTPGDALMVVTAFNTETIYQTVTIVPSNGPYITYATHNVNDLQGNNNSLVDYGESVYLTVELTNVGNGDANNVDVVLSTEDEYITITDGTENYGNILTGDSISVSDAFAFDTHNDIPDNHLIVFNIEATGTADETWSSSFSETAHAPVLEFGGFTIADPSGNNNGKLDPGETAEITIETDNTGSSEAFEVYGELLTSSVYITIEESTLLFGDIAGGCSAQQVYIVTADNETPAGHQASFEINYTANSGITGNGSFSIIVGQIPVFILDLDGNNNSSPEMIISLENLGITPEYSTLFPEDLNLYSSVFLCLGIYFNSTNHVLTDIEGQILADYLNDGGMLYMEGGDTWAYDNPTPVHEMFNINGTDDGTDDLGPINGQDGSLAQGMTFDYSGDNSYMDHISPIDPAVLVFENAAPIYGCAVSFDASDYKTIGASFEFGGLDDGSDGTKDDLMIAILDFFCIENIYTGIYDDNLIHTPELGNNYPNPFVSQTTIGFELKENTKVTLEIYNINGQKIKTLVNEIKNKGFHKVKWNVESSVPVGIYFYQLKTGETTTTRKMILMK